MHYSYVEIEYVATDFSPARTDLAVKLLRVFLVLSGNALSITLVPHPKTFPTQVKCKNPGGKRWGGA
jgi:hypothetical protein